MAATTLRDSMIEFVPPTGLRHGDEAGADRRFPEARLRHSTRVPLVIETDLLDVAGLMRRIEPVFDIDGTQDWRKRVSFWLPLFDEHAAAKEPVRYGQLFAMVQTCAESLSVNRRDASKVSDNAILFTAMPLKLMHQMMDKIPGGKLLSGQIGASVHLLPPLARHSVLDRLAESR